MAKKLLCLSLICILAGSIPGVLAQSAPAAQPLVLEEGPFRGASQLGQAIKRLGVVASVLHTGAHPDDEDSALLAYLARGRQARTAYLSLTRGDGGQNLIGPELYEALGVIRTEEMLAARRIDGASQFFTRAYDFGFSKSADETLRKWNREAVLSDMVRVIRTFRPFVVVSRWSGTPRDGHGHHQAAGLLTQEAVEAAGDPSRFPDQVRGGLRPWRPMKFYMSWSERRADEANKDRPTVTINTGQYDSLIGRSYYEIAMEGRSLHRSQDQGALERKGPQFSRLKLIKSGVGTPEREADLFENLDTGLLSIASFAGSAASRVTPMLEEVQRAADEALRNFNPLKPEGTIEPIARGLKKLRDIRALLPQPGAGEDALFEAAYLLAQKEQDFANALILADGVTVDCLSDDEVVTPGQTFNLKVSSYSGSATTPLSVSLQVPRGWVTKKGKETRSTTDGRQAAETEFAVSVPPDAEIEEPYWLKQPRDGDMFVAGGGGTGIEPLNPPRVLATVEMTVGGERVTLSRPAQYRYADKALGEIRHEVKVTPRLSVSVSPRHLIYPLATKSVEREVNISVVNNSAGASKGEVKLAVPGGWVASPASQAFDLKQAGERASFIFQVKMPAQARQGSYPITAGATVEGGGFESGSQLLAYPHIEPRMIYRRAATRAEVFDVKTAPGLRVGYVEGAGDEFAEALRRLQVDVKTISPRELASGNLRQYDVIVTGIRVYEVRPDVVENNNRLLEFARQGGTLIVQYNKNEFTAEGLAPYPIKMKQPPDRVTDEKAAVTLLDAAHPIFTYPNKITQRDFDAWVQERGAYFLSEWDSRFKPLLTSHDLGEEPKAGGMLVANYGKGLYVYTAYAWFRQLPEGVPGAYRLIANLVSIPRAAPARVGAPSMPGKRGGPDAARR